MKIRANKKKTKSIGLFIFGSCQYITHASCMCPAFELKNLTNVNSHISYIYIYIRRGNDFSEKQKKKKTIESQYNKYRKKNY